MAPSLAPMPSLIKIDMCSDLVGMAGFEPAASCSQSRRANQAAPHPVEPNRSLPSHLPGPAVPRCPHGVHHDDHPAGPARSRRTKPRHSALPGPARAVRPRCRETGTLSMLTRCQTQPSAGTRGRNSMAEPQPSKLVMRVRFPSPAPMYNPRSEGTRSLVAILWRSVSVAGRAIHVPLRPLDAAFDERPRYAHCIT